MPGEPLAAPRWPSSSGNAQHGNIAAFEQLMAMHKSKILSYARAFVSDAEQAHDVAQDAMLRIYRSARGFRHQSSLQTWMFRNHSQHRARLRQKPSQQRTQTRAAARQNPRKRRRSEPASDSPEAQLLAHERKSQLWLALAEVPETYRSVLVLCDPARDELRRSRRHRFYACRDGEVSG